MSEVGVLLPPISAESGMGRDFPQPKHLQENEQTIICQKRLNTYDQKQQCEIAGLGDGFSYLDTAYFYQGFCTIYPIQFLVN